MSAAEAQDTPAQTDSLVAIIDGLSEKAGRLIAAQETASGEDSLVLILEIERVARDEASTFRELSGILAQARDSATGPPAIPGEVSTRYQEFFTFLWGAEERVSDRLGLIRAGLFRAEGREAEELDRALAQNEAQLSRVHAMLLTHLEDMERIGMEVEEGWSRLGTRLEVRAEGLAGRIRLMDQWVSDLRERLAADPENADVAGEVRSLNRRLATYIDALESTTSGLRQLDRADAEYEALIVTHTGDLARGIVDVGVARSLLDDWRDHGAQWVRQNGLPFLLRALVFLLVLLVTLTLSRAVRRAVEKALMGQRVNVSHLLRKMIISFSGNLIILLGLLIALSQVGLDLGPVLAGIGVAGFIVGFALQDTLGNFAAGIMILFYQPYDVGDLVEVSGVFGTVHHMSLVSTTILTIDNQTLVVPNGKIWGDVIRNVTAQKIRRVDLVFGISYSDDIPKAEKILMSILKDHEKVLDDPGPVVRLYKLNDSSVDFVVRPWVATEDYWNVYWDVTREVKMRFDAEGVSIPFPQRDVHHYVEHLPPSALAAVARGAVGGDEGQPLGPGPDQTS